MSREEWEVFDQIRRERQERRRQQLRASSEEILSLHTLCNRLGLWMNTTTPTHWKFGLRGAAKNRLSYWPSTQKMQHHPGTKVSAQIDVERLKRALERLANV